MTQSELFDPADTVPEACPHGHCQAIRHPGQHQVITCAHDLNPEHRPRPKGCLNAIDNRYQGIPY